MLELVDDDDSTDVGELTETIAFQELSYLLLMGLATVPAVFEKPVAGLAVGAVLRAEAAFCVVLLWNPAYRWAIDMVTRFRPLRRFEEQLQHVRPAFLRLFHRKTALAVLSTDLVSLVLAFLLFELALHAVGANSITFAQAAFTYALAHVLGAVSMLPGGLGIYEGVMAGFIALQGATPSQGAAATLLYRGFNDVLMALIGVGVGAWLKRSKERRQTARKRPAERRAV